LRDIDFSTYDWIGAEGKIGPDGRILSLACGWTHPGGGPLEHGRKPDGKPDFSKTLIQGESQNRFPFDGDYSSRYTPDGLSHFRESGVLEGDCLLCHMSGYRMNRRNLEIGRRNYRWAATAGAGLGEIKGTIFEYRDPKAGPDDDSFVTGTWNFSKRPSVHYLWENRNIFTKEGKFKGHLINRKVSSKNCLQCHGDMDARKSGTHYAAPSDVHIAAGFQCTDCHGLVGSTKTRRLKHQIARGWSPERTDNNKLDGVGMKTCAGCHLDGQYRQVRGDMPKEAKNPAKVHKEKFPRANFHFYLLQCSVCHSTGQPGKGIYLADASTGGQIWYTADSMEKVNRQDDMNRPAAEPWKPWVARHERGKGDGERYIPGLSQISQWFGERLENGEIRPISLRYVRQAFRGLKGITVVEVKNMRGEKVKEPTVATDADIRLMIKTLTGMGFRNVVFVADRVYEVQQGKVASLESPSSVQVSSFPAYHKVSQWFGEMQENGEIKPINLQYVLQAFRSLEGITLVEVKNARGKKGMEPTVATGHDIRIAIKALSEMGFKNVVFVANRLYEVQQGKLKSFEIPKSFHETTSPAYQKASRWFGEKQEDGKIKPIGHRFVRQALNGLKGLTWVEIKNAKGEKVMEPTVATETDIRLMIKALSDMGLKNVALVSANRLYEVRQGKIKSSQIPLAISGPTFPVYHNVLPVEKKKTYGAKGGPDGCLDCHGEAAAFFTRMKVLNVGRFLKEDYPAPKEPNAAPQMYEWGIRNVPAYE
jgi:hypothetical protein